VKLKIFNYFEIAAKTAIAQEDIRTFLLGAVGIRGDGVIVKSNNGPTPVPDRRVHAEYKLCKKLDYGATIYVARIRVDNNQFAMARPCKPCLKALRHRRAVKVYYTISQNEFGIYDPSTDDDRYYYIES
jgi:tRNA(Arg) A34 adenosine deaminase TadA